MQKRRIYDITNVLEGNNLMKKTMKDQIKWIGGNINEYIHCLEYADLNCDESNIPLQLNNQLTENDLRVKKEDPNEPDLDE